jgi:hypothetical protein
MSLDLARVAVQVEEMAEGLAAERRDRAARLDRAVHTLHAQSGHPDTLRKRVEASRTSWLVAGIGDDPAMRQSALPLPQDFAVLASDGSHIDVDRHSPARCALINIGTVMLRYGSSPDAFLGNTPTLYTGSQNLSIINPLGSDEQRLEGAVVGMKRDVAECNALADLALESTPHIPTLALFDGSLIMWGLAGQTYPDFVKAELLDNGFLAGLAKLRDAGRERQLAVASYISFPRSTDVVNALRVAVCPHDPPNCDLHCRSLPPTDRPCDEVAGIQDSSVFSAVLEHGERSATFISRSSIVRERYGEHEIMFSYLKTDEEIGRVEFPRWVEERGLVDLLHSLILDQCRRGHGYPVALSEAHEQAVVNASDRQRFQELVEAALADHSFPTLTSAKSRSKRTRWI